MSEKEETPDLGGETPTYMERLSAAYQEAFAKRLRMQTQELSEEKRALIVQMQLDLSRAAGKLALSFRQEEKKELSRMIKEDAEETLRALHFDEEEIFAADPFSAFPPAMILSHAVLIANRSLNLLLRHNAAEEKPVFLILSELSALYALAAIN